MTNTEIPEQLDNRSVPLESTQQKWRWWVACTAITIAAWFSLLFWITIVVWVAADKTGWPITTIAISIALAVPVWLRLNRSHLLSVSMWIVGFLSVAEYGVMGHTWWVLAPISLLVFAGVLARKLPSVQQAESALAERNRESQLMRGDQLNSDHVGRAAFDMDSAARWEARDIQLGFQGIGKYAHLKHKTTKHE